MKTKKNLGIWMDHSSAHLMEFTADPIQTNIIESATTQSENRQNSGKNENVMHNKEQHQQSEYYKNLGDKIINYEEVILFGPTDAKVELFNILKADHRFENIKIVVKPADKMTENQQHAFVRDHFQGAKSI